MSLKTASPWYRTQCTHLPKTLLFFTICWLLAACRQGYQQENHEWVWVTYNEAVGRSVAKLDSVDNATFKVLDNKDYGMDKHSVFYLGQKIDKADPQTFAVLGGSGYAKDGQRVFLGWSEVILADPATFEPLEFPYAKDKHQVYCGTLPMPVPQSEIADFKVTQGDGAKTSTAVDAFIQFNPDYAWLDTLGIMGVTVGEYATAETKTRKFKGFRELIVEKSSR
jgi:hypothetical protein